MLENKVLKKTSLLAGDVFDRSKKNTLKEKLTLFRESTVQAACRTTRSQPSEQELEKLTDMETFWGKLIKKTGKKKKKEAVWEKQCKKGMWRDIEDLMIEAEITVKWENIELGAKWQSVRQELVNQTKGGNTLRFG